jgi:leader peptidase (prepilin peptidase)/N-methyltransferase
MINANQIGSIIYLGILSVLDIRTRKIPVWLLAAGGIVSITLSIYQTEIPIILVLAGGITGVVFLGVSKITREAIGYGDSLCILIIGVYVGIWNLIGVLSLSFLLSGLCAVLVLIFKNFDRKAGYPFIPFLFISHLLLMITGGF